MFYHAGSKDGEPEQLNALLGQKLPHHASGAISTLMTLEKEGDSKKDRKLRYTSQTICCLFLFESTS